MSFARFRYWLPVVLWMIVIFLGSTGLGAPRNSSRLIGPILHWLVPDISREREEAIIYGLRKCAHVTEYGILSLLAWRAIHQGKQPPLETWSWTEARLAIITCAIYASTDELHQYIGALHGSGREGTIRDVFIDSFGATLAMLLLWTLSRKRKVS